MKKHSPTKTLKLIRISKYTTEEDIKELLEEKNILVQNVTITIPLDDHSGLSRGIAYIKFESLEESINAEKELEDESLKGQMIYTDFQ